LILAEVSPIIAFINGALCIGGVIVERGRRRTS